MYALKIAKGLRQATACIDDSTDRTGSFLDIYLFLLFILLYVDIDIDIDLYICY